MSHKDMGFDVTNDDVNTYLYNANGQICAVESYDSTLHMAVMTGYLTDRSSSVEWSNGERVAKGFIPEFVKP